MKNIDFLKAFAYYSLIKKRRYICREGFEHIQNLYRRSKECGLTDEQREKFFTFVRCHNKEVHSHIREISKRLSSSDVAIYEDFDESELGAFAGRHCIGYERLISEEEETRLESQQELLSQFIISFKNEVIKRDPVCRIPLIETLKLWRQNVDIELLKDDVMNSSDIVRNYNTNIIRSLGDEHCIPKYDAGSPDDLP